VDYIATYKDQFGVEPIVEVLNEHGVTIALSTYYARAARGFGPSEAELLDAYAANDLRTLWVKNRGLYGQHKLWKAARRAGVVRGRDQVARLMAIAGIRGVRRGKRSTITTKRDQTAPRHPDHINRAWDTPTKPDQWGLPISLTCGPWPGSSTSPLSPTSTPGESSAGASRPPRRHRWCSQHSSRRSSPGAGSAPMVALSSPPPASSITPMPVPKADSSGRRNTSMMGVFSGEREEPDDCVGVGTRRTSAAVGCGQGVAAADALTGSPPAVACGAACVLALDRRGLDE
jgi:hypothetical protein